MGHFIEDPSATGGAHVRTRTYAERLEATPAWRRCCSDGSRLPADVLVIGLSVRSDVELAERAGLPVDNGILVDEHLQATEWVWGPSAT